MAHHLDVPDNGLFGSSPFGGSDTLTDAIAELDEEHARLAQNGNGNGGNGGGNAGPLPQLAMPGFDNGPGGQVMPDQQGALSFATPQRGPLPAVIPQVDSAPAQAASFGPVASGGTGPVPPGGRPPGYDVPGMPYTLPNGTVAPRPGSSSKAAISLLACLGAGAGAGLYFKDVRGAAVGFLGTGAALNILHGRSQTSSPDPVVKQDGIWTSAASLIGLGIAAYLGYGLYQERKRA